MDIYDRQKTIELHIPKSVIVIGVGGVGSWVGLNFALSGVPKLTLIDPDIVEDTNLNRTPFRIKDIGERKVHALGSIIYERREDIALNVLDKRVENCVIRNLPEVVVDCRDNSTPLSEELREKVKIIGGYDGKCITIHVNPTPDTIWGDDEVTYTHTPSWLIPPQLIANIIVGFICDGYKAKDEQIVHLNLKGFIDKILGGELLVDNLYYNAQKV